MVITDGYRTSFGGPDDWGRKEDEQSAPDIEPAPAEADATPDPTPGPEEDPAA